MRKIPWLIAAALLLAASAAQANVPVPPVSPGAEAHMVARDWLWGEGQLLALAIPAFFLFTGLGARLRGWCARVTGANRYGTLTLFAALYLILNALILLPFDYYRLVATVPDAKLAPWALGEIVPLGVKIVAAALFAWIPYALIARSPKRWWLYATVLLAPVCFAALIILPIWVDPLTTDYTPLKDQKLYAEIEDLAARCGVAHIPVFAGGDDTTVVGLGPTNRIILESDLTKIETPSQIRFTVGHELKHYVMGDNYKALAIIVVSLLVGFWLFDRLGRRIIAGGRFGISGLSDPASLPLAVLILTLYWLAITPLFNFYARSIEHEADRFGLELTHENDGLAQNEAGYITRDREVVDWDTFFLIFRATHPSNGERIRFANSYHPWAEGKPLVYGDVCKPEPTPQPASGH